MDKTEQLLAKSQQYLRSAAVLLEVGDYDSCASRAYFAMFYAAQAALLTTGATVKSRRSVRSAFVERFVEGGRFPQRAADVLHEAYKIQETADYAQRIVVDESDAEQTLSEAEAFIGSIDALVRRQQQPAPSTAPSSEPAAGGESDADESSQAPSEQPEASADAEAEEQSDEATTEHSSSAS